MSLATRQVSESVFGCNRALPTDYTNFRLSAARALLGNFVLPYSSVVVSGNGNRIFRKNRYHVASDQRTFVIEMGGCIILISNGIFANYFLIQLNLACTIISKFFA